MWGLRSAVRCCSVHLCRSAYVPDALAVHQLSCAASTCIAALVTLDFAGLLVRTLQGLPEVMESCSKEMSAAGSSRQQLHLPDRGAIGRVQAGSWAALPRGASSLLVQTVEAASKKPAMLLLFSERPR